MRMTADQSSYLFRREVDDYQMERVAVGLPVIPDSELVIGIMNRVDQSRFGEVNVGTFPTRAEQVWNELKDSQAVSLSASIHIIASADLIDNIVNAEKPISVQGITKDITRVTLVRTLRTVGLPVYHSPHVAANILSYARLQDTHVCTFKDEVFQAIPEGNGPILTFTNINGHYTMDIDRTAQVYAAHVSENISRYNKRQIDGAKRAFQFMERLGFISYKAAAEVVRRSSIANIGFTRADLVACQDIYGRSVAYQMGHGTQRNIKPGEDDPIPLHEAVDQELQIDTFFMFGG